MRVATYSRVSTERDQDPTAQRLELRAYSEARGWSVVEEIVDQGYSGGTDQRPGLKRLMAMVRAKEVDVVLVTKLDRIARSLKALVAMLDEFSALGVQFISLRDQIDMGSASGRLMVHIIGAFAEFERCLISERTKAGLAHVRASGVKLGRPAATSDAHILALRAKGKSYRAIAAELGCSTATVRKALRAHVSKTPPDSSSGGS